MKICLVFPPFAYSELPFSIALLKSYLKDKNPGVTVRNLDLNQAFYRRLRRYGNPVSCDGCPSGDLSCRPPRMLVTDGQFKSMCSVLGSRKTLHENPSRFLREAFFFQDCLRSIRNCYNTQLKRFIETGSIPDALAGMLEEDAGRILSEDPAIVGFSVLTLDNLPYALALAAVLKRRKNVAVILGGAITSYLNVDEILRACPAVDFIVRGEGEIALSAFVEAFPSGRFDRVPNLVYRQGASILQNEQEYVKDLDALPFPDYSDYRIGEYLLPEKTLSVISSRGCYWAKCAFCIHYFSYANCVRMKSVKRFVDELEHCRAAYGISTFFIVDEMISAGRFSAICDEILRRGLKIRFGTKALKPDNHLTREILEKGHRAGLRWMLLGVESFTQRVLDTLQKGTTVESNISVIESCVRTGIKPYIMCITGLPFQSEEDFLGDLETIRRIVPYPAVNFSRFYLGSDSLMAREPERFGLRVLERKKFLTANGVTIYGSEYDYETLDGLHPDLAVKTAVRSLQPQLQVLHQMYDFMLGLADFDFSGIRHAGLLDKVRRRASANAVRHAAAKPATAHGRYLAGLSGFLAGRYEAALRQFRAAARFKTDGEFRRKLSFHVGRCCQSLGRFDEALDAYAAVLKGDPENHAVLREKAMIHYARGEYARAAGLLGAVLPQRAGDARAYYVLGKCLERAGEYEHAIPELIRAGRTNPRLPEIHFLLAACYEKTGRPQESARELARGFDKLRAPAADAGYFHQE